MTNETAQTFSNTAGKPDPNAILVVNEYGLEFCIRMVFAGDAYGTHNSITHDASGPLVEFYDTRYPHSEHGQFVSCYYASTLLRRSQGLGLALDTGSPDWVIDARSMMLVLDFIVGKCVESPCCLH